MLCLSLTELALKVCCQYTAYMINYRCCIKTHSRRHLPSTIVSKQRNHFMRKLIFSLLIIFHYSGPPKGLLEELQSAVEARMAGESRGVPPLENLGTSSVRYKHTTRRSTPWIWLVTLGLFNHPFNIPGSCSHNTWRWQNGFRFLNTRVRGKLSWQSIWLNITKYFNQWKSETQLINELECYNLLDIKFQLSHFLTVEKTPLKKTNSDKIQTRWS